MTLNLIYRCCDTVSACSMLKPRIFNLSKQQIVFKCLESLEKAIGSSNGKIDMKNFVIADKCTDSFIDKVKATLPNAYFTFLDDETGGNAKSFCKCVEIASSLPEEDLAFFLEDDYLFLDSNALTKMKLAIDMLYQIDGIDVAITPDDYPDRWKNYCRTNAEMRITPIGHFMRIHHTTCTFCMMVSSIKKNIENLRNFRYWPFVNEDMCINKCWKDIHLYQPIPGWTCHFQEDSTIPMYLNRNSLEKAFI